MGAGIFWELFENTGSIEAYLAYSKTDEEVSDLPVDSNQLENNGFEGEK